MPELEDREHTEGGESFCSSSHERSRLIKSRLIEYVHDYGRLSYPLVKAAKVGRTRDCA